MNRYHRIIKNFIKNLFNRRTLPLILCIVGILIVFILVSSMGGDDKQVTAEDTAFHDQSRILVGIVPGDKAMCTIDENGSASGYECELIRTVLEEYYPNIPIEFTEIDSQIASYQLRNGYIDLAIGTFTKNVTKTQGLSLSVPYFTDGLYAYIPEDSSVTSLAELQGHTVYLTSTEFPAAVAADAFSALELEVSTISCSSYPDAYQALSDGSASAIIGMKYRMSAKDYPLKFIDQRLADVTYHILAWTDNSNVITLINNKLNTMLEDGSLDELRAKYGLTNTEESAE